jgi:hypothetical protein
LTFKAEVEYLDGPGLNWAVAKAEHDTLRKEFVIYKGEPCFKARFDPETHAHYSDLKEFATWTALRYSTEWSRGGPIVDKLMSLGMEVFQGNIDKANNAYVCRIDAPNGAKYFGEGMTLLIAAMRLYVCVAIGQEVELPDGL